MSLIDRIGFDAGNEKLEDAIDFAIKNNFFYLDFNIDKGPNHLDSWDKDRILNIRNLCDKNAISIGLHTLSAVNIAEYSPRVSSGVDEYTKACVDLSDLLDCSWIVVHGGYHFTNDYEDRIQAAVNRLIRVCDYASKSGQKILLENLNFEPKHSEVKYLTYNIEECKYFFEKISSENLGWAFTVNHANLVPEGIDGFIDTFGVNDIGEVRLADNNGDYEVHLIPGEGNINFNSVFKSIESMGYTGHYSMAYGDKNQKITSRANLSESYKNSIK